MIYCPACQGESLYLAQTPKYSGEVAQQYATYATHASAVGLGCLTCGREWRQYTNHTDIYWHYSGDVWYWKVGNQCP